MSLNPKNFNNLCRICLKVFRGKQLKNLYTTSVKSIGVLLSDVLEEYSQIQISSDKNHPKNICEECSTKLINAYFLLLKIRDSTEKLLKINFDAIETDIKPIRIINIPDKITSVVANETTTSLEITKQKNLIQDIPDNFIKVDPTCSDDESDGKHTDNELEIIYSIVKENDSDDSLSQTEIAELEMSKTGPENFEQDDDEEQMSEPCPVDNELDAVSFLSSMKKDDLKSKKMYSFNYDDRQNLCKVCGKKFIRKSNLIDHLRLHANVRPFKCEYCSKAFIQIGNYKAHLRVHTKERPFTCHLCPKTYNQSGALKIHIRSHFNQKDYICEICTKAFTNASDLGKHKRVHDDIKKFKCEFCLKTYAQKNNLKNHIKNHHKKHFSEQ